MTEATISGPSFAATEVAAVTGRAWHLLDQLVRTHPVIGSPGQSQALDLLERQLVALDLTTARVRTPRSDLRADPRHVDVAAFGGELGDYWERGPLESVVACATFGSGGPTVLVNAHVDVDVVSDAQGWARAGSWREPYEVSGRMYGRGTCDTLGGVASFVGALELTVPYLRRCGRGTLVLQLVLDEETGGNGTVALAGRLDARPDVVLVVEPTCDVVASDTHGFEQLRIVLHGHPRHMVAAAAEDNAIDALPVVVGLLHELDASLTGEAGARTVLLGRVDAGEDASLPAARAVCDVTLALPPWASSGQVRAQLQTLLSERLRRWAPEVVDLGVRVDAARAVTGTRAWVERYTAAAGRVGVALSHATFPSACDARIFTELGIPTMVSGPGDLARAHSTDEYLDRSELDASTRVFASFLLDAFGDPAP